MFLPRRLVQNNIFSLSPHQHFSDRLLELCKELELQEGELLNDRQIDIAVHRFFEDLKKYVLDGDCIFELPYHDYQKLWMEFHKIRNYLTIVLIEADVDILLQRNYQRHPSRQIPTEYIKRSLESLGNFRILLHKEQFAFLFFNTGLVSVHTIVSSIMDLRDM